MKFSARHHRSIPELARLMHESERTLRRKLVALDQKHDRTILTRLGRGKWAVNISALRRVAPHFFTPEDLPLRERLVALEGQVKALDRELRRELRTSRREKLRAKIIINAMSARIFRLESLLKLTGEAANPGHSRPRSTPNMGERTKRELADTATDSLASVA